MFSSKTKAFSSVVQDALALALSKNEGSLPKLSQKIEIVDDSVAKCWSKVNSKMQYLTITVGKNDHFKAFKKKLQKPHWIFRIDHGFYATS